MEGVREKLKKSLCTCFPRQRKKCKFSRIRKPAKQIFIQRFFFFAGDENSRLFLCENENFIFALLLSLTAIFSVLCFSYVIFYLRNNTETHTILHITLNCLVSCGKELYTGKSDLIDGY